MSKLSRDDILKLARLSRLQLTDQEIEQYQEELSRILQYVKMLQDQPLDDVEPTYQVTGLQDVTRPDEIIDYQADPAALLKGAPSLEDNQFKVKRVVG